jgi:hypothetical protein
MTEADNLQSVPVRKRPRPNANYGLGRRAYNTRVRDAGPSTQAKPEHTYKFDDEDDYGDMAI